MKSVGTVSPSINLTEMIIAKHGRSQKKMGFGFRGILHGVWSSLPRPTGGPNNFLTVKPQPISARKKQREELHVNTVKERTENCNTRQH